MDRRNRILAQQIARKCVLMNSSWFIGTCTGQRLLGCVFECVTVDRTGMKASCHHCCRCYRRCRRRRVSSSLSTKRVCMGSID